MAHREHRADAIRFGSVVVTVSDSRTLETDGSGKLARDLLEAAGHEVRDHRIVPDEPDQLGTLLRELAGRKEVDLLVVNGGTGISPRDRTYEVVSGLLETRMDGFGELFRALSYQEIGPAAMLSRAVAGLVRGKVLFSVPGSPAAVRMALERLILPELGHIIGEARKSR